MGLFQEKDFGAICGSPLFSGPFVLMLKAVWRNRNLSGESHRPLTPILLKRAIRDAHADGFDWLLHIDSDEVLYLPGVTIGSTPKGSYSPRGRFWKPPSQNPFSEPFF